MRVLSLAALIAFSFSSFEIHATDWYVEGDAEALILAEDEDDGLDGDAEITLTVEWFHVDRERDYATRLVTTKTIQHNYDTESQNLSSLGLAQELDTVECDDGDWIYVTAAMTESDMSNRAEDVLIAAVGFTAGVLVGTYTAPVLGPMGGRIAGGLAGLATGKFLTWLGSGTDDLGSLDVTRLEFGNNAFQLQGKDGGGYIQIADNSYQSSSVTLECFKKSSKGVGNQNPVNPTEAVNGIFPHITAGLGHVAALKRENNGIDQEIRMAQVAMTEALVSGAEYAAATMAYIAQDGYLGAVNALAYLNSGRQHQENQNWSAAVNDFQEAYRLAYTALWNGDIGSSYVLPEHFTVVSPVRSVRPESYHEFTGWVQGLSPSETIQMIDVTGQSAGMSFNSFQGVARTAVSLSSNLGAGLNANQIIGLGRVSAANVSAPDGHCDVSFLIEGSIGAGIFIDGAGPYPMPASACGYGEVFTSVQDIPNGGIPPGSGPDPFGFFTLSLELDDSFQQGDYPMQVKVTIYNSMTMSTRELSRTIRLIYPDSNALFVSGFE